MKEIIKSGNIRLRKLEDSDKQLLLKWLTDERILNFWEGKSTKHTLETITEDYYTEEEDIEIIRAIIEYSGYPIGYVHMYKLNEKYLEEYEYSGDNKIVYGIDQFIGEPDYWNKGIGTEFLRLVLNYLTSEKSADSIILDPHADNLRAIRCYEKVGFKKIKFLPKHEFHDGEKVDCYLMEYLKN